VYFGSLNGGCTLIVTSLCRGFILPEVTARDRKIMLGPLGLSNRRDGDDVVPPPRDTANRVFDIPRADDGYMNSKGSSLLELPRHRV
jgi:hypothetical protein